MKEYDERLRYKGTHYKTLDGFLDAVAKDKGIDEMTLNAAAREVAEVCDGCSETYLVDPKTFACAVEEYLRHQGA